MGFPLNLMSKQIPYKFLYECILGQWSLPLEYTQRIKYAHKVFFNAYFPLKYAGRSYLPLKYLQSNIILHAYFRGKYNILCRFQKHIWLFMYALRIDIILYAHFRANLSQKYFKNRYDFNLGENMIF